MEKDWPGLMKEAADALEDLRPRLSIPKDEHVHRRGAFPAIRCGVSHGGGSTSPGNLRNEKANADVVDELVNMSCFQRLAGFASCKCFWPSYWLSLTHVLPSCHGLPGPQTVRLLP